MTAPERAGHGQQPFGLVLVQDQRQLLRLLDVVDLGREIVPPQRDAEQESHPRHGAIAIADANPLSARCSWKRRTSSAVAVSGERCSKAANRLQLWMWLLCDAGPSLRAAMSSIMRWQSGLIGGIGSWGAHPE